MGNESFGLFGKRAQDVLTRKSQLLVAKQAADFGILGQNKTAQGVLEIEEEGATPPATFSSVDELTNQNRSIHQGKVLGRQPLINKGDDTVKLIQGKSC